MKQRHSREDSSKMIENTVLKILIIFSFFSTWNIYGHTCQKPVHFSPRFSVRLSGWSFHDPGETAAGR